MVYEACAFIWLNSKHTSIHTVGHCVDMCKYSFVKSNLIYSTWIWVPNLFLLILQRNIASSEAEVIRLIENKEDGGEQRPRAK